MTDPTVKVIIRTSGTEVEFEGGVDEVWTNVNRFFSELYPSIEIVKRLTGSLDVKELAEKLAGKVEIKENRINVILPGDAKTKILVCLAGAFVGKALGLLDKNYLTPKEIANFTGIDERIVRARLSELRKDGLVVKIEGGLYGFTSASLREIEQQMRQTP